MVSGQAVPPVKKVDIFSPDPEKRPILSENSLYLNIWTPKAAKEPCPVAVWIHGGAFTGSYPAEMQFDGDAYARRGVILVTAAYRLGIFGFFCHEELRARDGHSGNYGLMDQIAALDWVRENIAAFGGDPENIMLFGQSAGAMSARTVHLAADQGEDPPRDSAKRNRLGQFHANDA